MVTTRLKPWYEHRGRLIQPQTDDMMKIVRMLQTTAVICSDGDVLQDLPQGFDP